ncbi:MAG: phosphatase PAP2 family protein [Anaerolineae bacterium]|nr:phosphatase PAP2 family protein [Anaerolineae bacterium]
MEELYQLGVALATWVQNAYPQLVGVMTLVSALGTEEFYLVVLPAFYWCINKGLGRQLGYLFLLSTLTNNILKNTFRQPRPFWIDPNVQLGETEGYGLPSGHVQNATVVYLLLAARSRRVWAWLLAFMFIALMGFSRFYLGVHFVQDLAVGFTAGLLILGAFMIWQITYFDRFSKQILGRRLLLLVSVPLLLAAIYIGILLLIGKPDTGVPWGAYVPAAELDGYEQIVSTVAGLLGFGVGILLESSRIRFRTDGPVWQRAARYLLGVVIAVGIWAGLRAIFPSEPLWVALPLRFIRYLILLLWITYFAPWVFVRLRLAAIDTESEVRVTL